MVGRGGGGEGGGRERARERDPSGNDQSTQHCARCTCGPVFAEEKIDPLQKTVRHTKGPLFPRTRPIPPTSLDVAPFESDWGFRRRRRRRRSGQQHADYRAAGRFSAPRGEPLDCSPVSGCRTILLCSFWPFDDPPTPLRSSVDTGAEDRGGASAEFAVVAETVGGREDVGSVVLR
jgi:hypothetical protein